MHEIVIHGHFYQPPREEPWLELVPREPTAVPDHDWNARITRQCYAPLAAAPIVDPHGDIVRIVNAYAWCSFDVGATLFRWLDRYAPAVRDAMLAADREAIARTGHGNAIAAPYHHVILPLLSRRDKITEIRWGVHDFRQHFQREPAGLWLPEAAVDDETLAVLAEERIRYTIVGSGQVDHPPASGRPGRWRGAADRDVAIFVYDGAASHQVAFGDVLENVAAWERSLLAFPEAGDGGPAIVSIATDGETFGHHHRHGVRGLAELIDRIGSGQHARMTNFSALLAACPPKDPVQVVSPSSWSCAHGVDRWARECGCRFEPGTSQGWRAPLREGLTRLADGIGRAVQRDWPSGAGDYWMVRDMAGPELDGAASLSTDVRRLLEATRHGLAMFTSCAWFFDDLARLEPRIVLRHAARALDLLPRSERDPLEAALLATLAAARSNDASKGDGVEIWRRDIVPDRDGPARLAAGLATLRELAPDAIDDVTMPAHRWTLAGDDIVLEHRRTGETSVWHAEPITFGVLAIRVHLRAVPADGTRVITIAEYPDPVRDALRNLAAPMVYDAALPAEDANALRSGLLDPATARARALQGAWLLVARDGLDAAGIVVHSVLDLYDLDGEALDSGTRATAFGHLVAAEPSRMRDALAERFGVAFTPAD